MSKTPGGLYPRVNCNHRALSCCRILGGRRNLTVRVYEIDVRVVYARYSVLPSRTAPNAPEMVLSNSMMFYPNEGNTNAVLEEWYILTSVESERIINRERRTVSTAEVNRSRGCLLYTSDAADE